jgi:hypothetical protein
MRTSPSIVPVATDRDIYLVLDDFGGRLGRAWRETDEASADRAAVIRGLLEGQYADPVRIIAFNTAEGWSRDVTDDIADELRERGEEVPASLSDFLERHDHDRGRPFEPLTAGN